MARETVQAKAARYLAEGRLTVVQVDGRRVRARCHGRGDHVYLIEREASGWRCSCPARKACAHIEAAQLVTVERTSVPSDPSSTV